MWGEQGRAEARLLRSPLNGAGCAHADVADVRERRWPEFTHHPQSQDGKDSGRDDAAERQGQGS